MGVCGGGDAGVGWVLNRAGASLMLRASCASLASPFCCASCGTCCLCADPHLLLLVLPHPAPCAQVVFSQGTASTVGVLLRSWHQAGEGGAAVLFNWETSLLEVVFEALDPATMTFSLTAPLARRIGGNVSHRPGAPLALRLLLDGRWV